MIAAIGTALFVGGVTYLVVRCAVIVARAFNAKRGVKD
jgi:hypothetical protein